MSMSQKMMKKMDFKDKNSFIGFMTVLMAGQIIYSAFEAFKGTFYNLLLDVLGVTNAQLGSIFSLIGISMFLYIPAGWVNNRFSTKSILITGLLVRFTTMNYVIFAQPGYEQLRIVAIIWGVVDAFFWPAVLNGVILMTNEKNRSMGFGLLESVRRAMEVLMNFFIVSVMSIVGGLAVFKGGMFVYNLLIIPLVFLIIKYVPKNGISVEDTDENKSVDALKGLFQVMLRPQVWLASLAAMAVYWCYIILIYTVPYLQAVYNMSSSQAAIFGIFNTGVMGIIAGVTAGTLASKVFKSSSLLMAVALLVTAGSLTLIQFVPQGKGYLMLAMVILFVFSFAIFLAKSIILAPVSEVDIPEKYSGSAMSVGSFLAYAPIFWVYQMNGSIIDEFQKTPAVAYSKIFQIGIVVALAGAGCSFALIMLRKRGKK